MADDIMDTSTDQSMDPKDKSRLLLFVFYVLGMITYVPQNFYITANDYWMYKFRDPNVTYNNSDNNKTELQRNFTAYYTTISSICMITFLILTVIYVKKVSLQRRIVGPLVIILLLFFVTMVFIWTDTDSWQQGFFIVSLIIGALISAATGCFLISIFQLSSKFPPIYLGAQLSGQTICGIIAALTQIFILLTQVSSKTSAMIYFSLCVSLLLATLVFYLVIFRDLDYFHIQLDEEDDLEENGRKIDFNKVKIVGRKIVTLMVTMVLASGILIIIHPGVTSLVNSVGEGTNRWSDVFFVPVCTFLSYSVFDFIGREVSLHWKKLENVYLILTISVLRIGFIPLIMLCNAQPRNHLPVVFDQDYTYIIFMIIFAFTTGYFLNLCVLEIPSICEPNEKNYAVVLVAVAMVISTGVCSGLGSLMVHLL